MNHHPIVQPVDHVGAHLVDAAAVGTLGAVFFGWLPHVTAVLTFIWVCIRLCETDTVRGALNRARQWLSG